LAAAKCLGNWLLASAIGLAAAKWLGYWLLALAIGLAAAKGLGFGFWLLASAIGLAYALLQLIEFVMTATPGPKRHTNNKNATYHLYLVIRISKPI